MTWLLHNGIADIYGPYSLCFYPVAIVTVILACYQSVRSLDRTRDMEPKKIPAKLDPYEIAYLRGGETAAARVVIVSLIERGLLQINERRDWSSTALAILKEIDRGRMPEPGELSMIEARIMKWPGFPATTEQVLEPNGLPAQLRGASDHYQDNLAEQELLAPRAMKQLGAWLWWIGSALILGLGGCMLAFALASGPSNVALFVFIMAIMAFVGVIALAPACLSFPRISHRGQAYLEQLEFAYERLRSNARPTAGSSCSATGIGDPGAREPMQRRSLYSDRLLMNAIFGTVSPADTPLTDLLAALVRIGFFPAPGEPPPMG
jgi:uncharacterized protein (TIGR04222 family)